MYMKKILLSLSLVAVSFSGFSQTTIIEDNFDSYNDFVIQGFGNWTTIDFDLLNTYTGGTSSTPTWANAGAAQAWQIFNPTTAAVSNAVEGQGTPPSEENRNFDPRSGAKFAASWAAVPSTTGGATNNDDWLISPAFTLGTSGNILSVYVKSLSDSYGLEEYNIGIYIGSDVPTQGSQFELLTSGVAPYGQWEEVAVDLDAYAGATVRIGIQNFGSDHYMLMVDDFKVTTTGLGVNDVLSSSFTTFPNPVNNVLNIKNGNNTAITAVSIVDINGRTIKTIAASSTEDIAVNTSDLQAGVYMVNIETEAGKAVKKFIKN